MSYGYIELCIVRGDEKDSLSKNQQSNEIVEIEEINRNSSDEEILDYVLLYLCNNLKKVKNYFKGGYILMKLLPDKARYSYDIDFSIGSEEQYETIKSVLRDLGGTLVSSKIIDYYEVKETITPTSSGGVKFKREGRKDLGIDIDWHDISYGMDNWSFAGYDLMRFSVERMLSDKLSAIYSRKRFRRAKDLYDVYILHNSFDIDFNKLAEYIIRRGTIEWDKDPFREDVAIQYAYAYEKLIVENPNNPTLGKAPFNECMLALNAIVTKVKEVLNE